MPSRRGEFRLQGRRAVRAAGSDWRVVAVMPLLLGACREREATPGSRASQSVATVAGASLAGPAGDARRDTPGAVDPTSPAAVRAPGVPADGGPRMRNPEPPFRYPAPLYARKVQGNVTLRLWVDATGAVRPESTRVAEPSGYPALDSSAVAGAQRLTFTPAMRDGRPHGAALLFPVYFCHPEAPPLPGDTVLGRRGH